MQELTRSQWNLSADNGVHGISLVSGFPTRSTLYVGDLSKIRHLLTNLRILG